MRCHFSSNSSTAYFLSGSQYETVAAFSVRCAIARTSWGSKMYVRGLPVTSEFTMTQKSPMILSRSLPSGTARVELESARLRTRKLACGHNCNRRRGGSTLGGKVASASGPPARLHATA